VSSPFNRRGGIVFVSSSPSRIEPVEFAAPVGRRVRLVSWFCSILVGGLAIVALAVVMGSRASVRPIWPAVLAPVVTTAIMVSVAWFSQVRGYLLTKDELLVHRRNRETRFTLDGLQSVSVDREAMAWSVKIFGNDGLGAITGRFRNKRLGAYQAFVTDRTRAVVLRWPDRCLVVSPDRPDEFAAAVRLRAGLQS
jgi:hypothetical protein